MLEIAVPFAILIDAGYAYSSPFNARRHLDTVVACQIVYSRLQEMATRLKDRQARTDGFLQSYRGTRRIASYVSAARAAAAPQGLDEVRSNVGLVLYLSIGSAEMDHPETDPHEVQVAFMRAAAQRCDIQLTRWGAPIAADLPEEVARSGFAEFRVSGKTAAETFEDAPTAALARAACEGDVPGLAHAIADGARINGTGFEGSTPLTWAIACENLPAIEALLAAGADPNQPIPPFGTPIIIAAGYRNPEILRSLLRHGGDVNAMDERETALSTAYVMGRTGAGWANFDTLLAAGADISRKAPGGETVVETAAMFRDYDRVLQLLQRGYAGDLVFLGGLVTADESNSNIVTSVRPQIRRVKEWLTSHGVRFPVRALGELQQDSRGFYIQR